MTSFKRSLALFTLVVVAASAALFAAPKAILSAFSGKVEVQAAGATAWIPAKVGMTLNTRDTLSTGFDASATITIDKNTLHVKSLTRMSIDKLVEQGGKVSTTTFLKVGSVDASIKSAEGVKQDFKVQSPYSTASVRGTEFTFDGLRLEVREGQVAFVPGPPRRTPPPQSGDDGEGDQEGDGEEEPEDETGGTLVGAGTSAVMEVSFDGDFQPPTSSDDLDALQEGTRLEGSDSSEPAPVIVPPTGTLKIKIILPEQVEG